MAGSKEEATGFQRDVTRTLTEDLHEAGFALAGSGAVREHGLIDRPTEDIDLFTVMSQRPNFPLAVREGSRRLASLGFHVETDTRHPPSDTFARLLVSKGGQSVEVDMCIDWRAHDPVWLDGVGYVLDVEDAVANKMTAVVSRGEIRDYLDALSIRRSGRFTDEELFRMAVEHDRTFTPELFASALRNMGTIPDAMFASYLSDRDLEQVRVEAENWADGIMTATTAGKPDTAQDPERAGDVHVSPYTRGDGTAVKGH